jgi:hypothetical protein
MDLLATPWCFIGPSGSGKISLARSWIERMHGAKLTYPLEVRTFSVGDGYEARVLTSPYHFEIDIPNLSMQDKQIIGELLTMFLSSGDVLNALTSSSRKLVILRRAHCLSLPAAIRVRSILQQYVLPANSTGMIWMTTREITGALSLLEDSFVRHRVPRMTCSTWCASDKVPAAYRTKMAWNKLEGHPERAVQMSRFFAEPKEAMWPRRIQDFYDEMVAQMIVGASTVREPNMEIVGWIRGRVYDALSFCQTGPEIIDSCAAAMERFTEANADKVSSAMFWNVMNVLAESEPHTSYRTPLALEWAMLNMFETLRTSAAAATATAPTTKVPTKAPKEPKTTKIAKATKAPKAIAAK